MSFDLLAVRPAELAGWGLEPPYANLERFMDEAPWEHGEPSPSLAALADELNRRHPDDEADPMFSAPPATAEPRGVYVPVIWPRANDLRRDMLDLGFERGLAIIDPQDMLVFDPTGSEWATVTTDVYPYVPFATPAILDQLLDRVVRARNHLIIEVEPELYVQTRFDGTGFDVEHRAGDERHHYQARATDRAAVRDALWGWLVEDDRWDASLAWSRLVF